jgi:hypothetical protein
LFLSFTHTLSGLFVSFSTHRTESSLTESLLLFQQHLPLNGENMPLEN